MNPETTLHIRECVVHMLNEQSISKHKITIEFLGNVGNYLSDIGKIFVKGTKENGENASYDLFVKVAKQGESREILSMKEFFNREIYTYKHVFSLFAKIQEESHIKDPFQVYPKFYTSSEVEEKEIIVLENMQQKGFRITERHQTFDYPHASILIKELGRLHALSFALKDRYPKLFQDIVTKLPDLEYHSGMRKLVKYVSETIFPKYLYLIDVENQNEVYKKVEHIQKGLFNSLLQCSEVDINDPYLVIVHGDLWVTNVMFKYNKSFEPTRVCLLDWQTTKISSPVIDISQLLFVCLSKKERDLYCDHLINDYYNSFSKFLMQFGGQPNVALPFKVLEDHLRKFSVCGLYTAIRMITLISISSEDAPDPNVENFMHALFNSKRNPNLFDTRMRDVLLDYVQYGYGLYSY
ncbi:hypothetical protein FQA39_LY13823 [Lamprigera yunnana]|nr:hypothetical protein FQA39_LY13823 [Lamprigera yunnana]